MYWSKSDVEKLRKFIITKAATLIPYFYQNIIEGAVKVRKYSGFYDEMGKFLGKTPKQCKSKFQKFEEQIYTKYLAIPQKDFDLLVWIRQNKDIHLQLQKRAKMGSLGESSTEGSQIPVSFKQKNSISRQNEANLEDGKAFECKMEKSQKSFFSEQESDRASGKKEYLGEEMQAYWMQLICKIKKGKPVKITSNIGSGDGGKNSFLFTSVEISFLLER